MTEKKPISAEWKKKLESGYLLELAEKGELSSFAKEFPKNMEIPKELLGKQNEKGRYIC